MDWSPSERAEVIALISSCRTLTLSTTDEMGLPCIAPVYYSHRCNSQLDFVSKEDTRHIQNLQHQPIAAGAVYREGSSLTEITGLQMRGTIQRGEQENNARKTYLARYGEIQQHPYLERLFQNLPIFRFTPFSVTMTDHDSGGIRRRQWQQCRSQGKSS
jgi:uncharacterized protein YhbP (UPF0306 family)